MAGGTGTLSLSPGQGLPRKVGALGLLLLALFILLLSRWGSHFFLACHEVRALLSGLVKAAILCRHKCPQILPICYRLNQSHFMGWKTEVLLVEGEVAEGVNR